MINYLLFVLPEYLLTTHVVCLFPAYSKLLYLWWKLYNHYVSHFKYRIVHGGASFIHCCKRKICQFDLLQFIQNNVT